MQIKVASKQNIRPLNAVRLIKCTDSEAKEIRKLESN